MRNNFIILFFFLLLFTSAFAQVSGVIFEDENKNGVLELSEKRLPNILVSNGRDVVKTNKNGEYIISILSGNPLFVIKPKGYISPKNNDGIIEFFVNTDDLGTKKQINFPLSKNKEQKHPKVVVLGDPQSDVIDDIHHISKLVTEELTDKEFDFMIPVGDLSFDNLKIFKPMSKVLGIAGKPVFYTIGNHDLDYTQQSKDVNKEYEKLFGPSYYAFEFGDEFFMVLNNINPLKNGKYEGRIDNNQYHFINNILKHKEGLKRLTLFMHIPLEFLKDKGQLISHFNEIESLFVIAGHTHTQYHKYFERASSKPKIHELVAGAVCGSWWRGPHDINGIPFALMDDGTRKGYWFLQYNKENYQLRYKVSGASKTTQMTITVPEVKEWDTALNKINEPFIYANVFAADKNTEVNISFDGKTWQKMNYYNGVSPQLKKLYYLQDLGRFESLKSSKISQPVTKSKHLWRVSIPNNLPKGAHLLRVKAINKNWNLNALGHKVFWK